MTDTANSKTVNDVIFECLNLEKPNSFFLFAGAGSGKTRSLVEVLKRFQKYNIKKMQLNGQRVAIITYTNAACDEIKRRLDFDPAFTVSTIHSFSWELIMPYRNDIRKWLKDNLEKEIFELESKINKARDPNGITVLKNIAKLESKKNRLDNINNVYKFIYNPNGVNSSEDSLNHTEVINIAASFLLTQQLMRKILVRKFPILLIDESQDTKKNLIDAFFTTQAEQQSQFCLGLFGDTMQRIYVDGKEDLGVSIPDTWSKPSKTLNYRCPIRVVELINKIRSDVDGKQQTAVKTNDGYVRLFIIDANRELDQFKMEINIRKKMADITGDNDWVNINEVKTLTLEHHMAASRGGFSDFFLPLYGIKKLSTGVLDGTLRGIPFLTQQLLPLVHATRNNDEFAVAQVIRKHSPLLNTKKLEKCSSQIEQIRKTEKAVNSVKILWLNDKNPSLISILKKISDTEIFIIPDIFSPLLITEYNEIRDIFNKQEIASLRDDTLNAWELALSATLSQLESYFNYISDNSSFGTHQGIKGLEFSRVMVILDDDKSKGFLFSYEKLLGAKPPSTRDFQNESEGKDSGIDRTRRLFYVTCSRAKNSLAIVAYTKDPNAVKGYAISQGWFKEEEIMKST